MNDNPLIQEGLGGSYTVNGRSARRIFGGFKFQFLVSSRGGCFASSLILIVDF